jgi:TolB protein
MKVNFPHRKAQDRIISSVKFLFSISLILFLNSACGILPTPIPTPTSTPTITPPSETPIPSLTSTEAPTQTPYIITATPERSATVNPPQGVFFLSVAQEGYFNLFVYSPETTPFTRITNNKWDSITPALSPDGKWLAFASNQNSYWDIYLLSLVDGKIVRLTDTPEYDSAPSWSPDGAYLTYESYQNGNLDIIIRSTSDRTQVYNLTGETSFDCSPDWSPHGRQIAFISNRSGEPEVWVADLDRSGNDRFYDVSDSPQSIESHPAWSHDGNRLAWSSVDPDSGLAGIYIWDARNPDILPQWSGFGDWPVWQDDDHISTRITTPNETLFTGYRTNGTMSLPPILFPGPVNGLSFGITAPINPSLFRGINPVTPSKISEATNSLFPTATSGRSNLLALKGVQASYPQIHEMAYTAFQALRTQIAKEAGWDALASLENAFVPLTIPLEPGMGAEWLYTGRAFTLNPALIQPGWMAIVRENIGQQTYWRIYLRTYAQDGSQGAPLTQIPWDFDARNSDPSSYENGGRLGNKVSKGYWVDLTSIASQYGWIRLPAQINWRTYYAGARFNELVFTQGLDWRAAMLQLYPPEILITPTIIIPPTRTPTRTPLWYISPTSSATSTFRPTHIP